VTTLRRRRRYKKEINAHIYEHFFTALLCFFPRSGLESQRRRRKIEQRHSQFFGESSFYDVDGEKKIRFYHQEESSSYETKEKIFIFLRRGGTVPINRRRRRRDERRREPDEDRHRDILLV
jgi:hypothetical protein